jgi:acetyltransferase EpsM
MIMEITGIGLSNDLIIIGGKANAFVTFNICKNLYNNIYYYSDRDYDKNIFIERGFIIVDSYEEALNIAKYGNYFIACGGNEQRETFFKQIYSDTKRYPVNAIHPGSYIEPGVKIGFGNLINYGCYININTCVGNLNILNTGVIIEHDNNIGNYNHLAPRVTTTGFVTIGNYNDIFTSTSIIPFKTIHDRVIVAANSVVIEDLYEGRYYGSPAKPLNKNKKI